MKISLALPLSIIAAILFVVAVAYAQLPADQVPALSADVNHDGYVNSIDLLDVAQYFGPVGENPCVPLLRMVTPVALYSIDGTFYSNLSTQLEIPPDHPQYAAFMAGTPITFWPCP